MGQKLEYSLGLSTSNFLTGVMGANQALELFKKAFHGLETVGEHAFEAIAHGRALRDLSARTGESVKNLFQLEKAFKEAGVSPEAVSLVLFRFQKSLSGVGEMGESTGEAFKALGVSIEQLARMEAPEALLKLFAGINKLDRNSATGVASTIFGRGAAGDVLQLARNWKDVSESMEHAAKKGETYQRNAEIFKQISVNMERAKNSFKGLWLGIAEDIAPALNGILASIANKDVPQFAKVLELSLTVAFEKAVNFFYTQMLRMVSALPELMSASVKLGQATVGQAMAKPIAELFALMSEGNKLPGREDVADEWAKAAELLTGPDADQLAEAAADFARAFAAAKSIKPVDLFGGGHNKELMDMLRAAGLLPQARPVPAAGGFTAANAPLGGQVKMTFGDANALERIGFGSGGSSPILNATRETAANTRTTYRSIDRVNATLERMERQREGGFANV